MSSVGELILWLGVIAPLVMSAGPGNVLCAVCGATNGFRQSLPFILGLDVVYTSYALLAGMGAALVITHYPTVFFAVQILGVVYIAWLGWQFIRRSNIIEQKTVMKLRFRDGVISQALNIKGVTIILTMYSQFLDEGESLVYEVLSLSGALLLLNLFTHSAWAYGGAWMAKKFASAHAVKLQNRLFGAMLILIALWLLYGSLAG